MEYLVYISTAKKLMNEQELIDILKVARENNEAANVTGMLLYSQGTFIQALEGEENDVDRIYKSIELDPRHKNLIKLITGETKERVFPDWSMAFASVNAETLHEVKGYLDPSHEDFIGDNKHASISMLKTFAETNRISVSF